MSAYPVSTMRELIMEVYPGPAWEKRVKFMSDNQVIAVYYSFLQKGKFEEKKRDKSKQVFNSYSGEQMRFEGF